MKILSLDVVTDPYKILKCLLDSKIKGTVIGINSAVLGSGTTLTGISDISISGGGEISVVLKGYDFAGAMLKENVLKVSQIDCVVPFTSLFENPLLRKIKRIHENVSKP
ncbi:MAG: hypothetical protein ACOYXT_18590 [Bacteroidota bacterium]